MRVDIGVRWVEKERDSGEAELEGIGPNPSVPLHVYWTACLKEAARNKSSGEEFTVTTTVKLKHESPGWVDGFRVRLD